MVHQVAPEPEKGAWSVTAALFALVFMRREVGCRLISTEQLLFGAFANFAGPFLIDFIWFHEPLDLRLLMLTSAVICGRGIWLQRQHSQELHGEYSSRVGTRETGKSHFHWLPLPPTLIYCVVDPLAFIGAGRIVMDFVSSPFGAWMMVCGAMFGLMEIGARYRLRREFLDAHDALWHAERQAAFARHHAQRSRPGGARRPSAGTPTGAGDDLDWHFGQRQD